MPRKVKVIMTVQGGVAEVLHDESAADVLVVDYDSAECMPIADLRCLLEEVENFAAPEFAHELEEITDELKSRIQTIEDEGPDDED